MQPIVMWRKTTLCAAAFGLALATSGGSVAAASAKSLNRFTIIAGGWQLERRCEHLDAGVRDTFGRIAAHAEIDMAGKHGKQKIMAVLAGAEQFGQEMGANCGDETRLAVNRSYAVAEEYATERTAAVETLAAARRKAERKRAQRRKTRQVATAARTPTQPASTGPVLKRFGAQTRAYYLQRRCGHLPYQKDLAFWKLIARQHHALIRKYGAGAVGRVERRAKASAYNGSMRCGERTRRMVLSGHSAIRQDAARN